MMLLKNYALSVILSLFIVSIIATSCGVSIHSSAVKDDGNQIPRELGKSATTMLVMQDSWKGHNKLIQKNFEQYYKGEYILATDKELKQTRYQDSLKYRYVFSYYSYRMRVQDFSDPKNFSGSTTMSGIKYQVFDRKEAKNYPSFYSSNYGKLMVSYIKKLNEVREKNIK